MKGNRILLLLAMMLVGTCVSAYDEQTDHLLSGDIICSQNQAMAPKAFDDNPTTYYTCSSGSMQYIGLDLGTQHVITRISYTSANSSTGADRMLLSLFEGANSPDFMDAIPLHLISYTPNKGVATSADVNVSRGFRYVRYVGGSGSMCQVAELKFYGHEGEGDDSQFYQVTNLPTLSIHVAKNHVPTTRGEDFESNYVLIYDEGKLVQEYPVLTRVRGNYSATPENKPYRLKFNDGKKHHMMKDSEHNESPVKAKKWVLLNSWRDKTLMRNPVGWVTSKRVGPKFTPWCQPVDLILNGDYRGTYILADQVSVSKGRIDITEMTEEDVDGEALTGGYFVEVDNNAGREPYHFTTPYGNPISVHDPDEDVMQSQQFRYIQDTFNEMEARVYSTDYTDEQEGYKSVLDLESFLRYFLISEFNGNTDMLCQVFMYKERGDDHFYTGPVWDHELALDDDETVFPGNNRPDWTYLVRDTGNWTDFVSRVLSDPSAMAKLEQMWTELRDDSVITAEGMAASVDSLRRDMRASARLNFIRWPYLNQYISLTPAIRGSWEAEVDVVRDYVYGRVAWMDKKLHYDTLVEENGVYQINTPRSLVAFSQLVAQGNTKIKGVLNADIDMEGYSDKFLPIGSNTRQFAGQFKGNGHVIRNLHCTGKNYVGLFGYITVGADISGVVLDSTCTFTGENYVGGLVGYILRGSINISKCGNAATVTASGNYAAGIVGYTGGVTNLTLSGCYNMGRIQAASKAAAIAGPSLAKLVMQNCYNGGIVVGAEEGHEFAYASRQGSVDNCYDACSSQVAPATPGQLASGELCFMLNGGQGETFWRQNIDNGRTRDAYPVFSERSGIVYRIDGKYTNKNTMGGKGYRYYKLHITGLQGGTSGTIQFSEFDLLDATGQEIREMTIYDGTPSNIPYEDWEKAADNSTTTKYCSAFHGSAYFLFDAKAPVQIKGYRLYTANDTRNWPERNPSSWKLYGSNSMTYDANDASWELIDERKADRTMGATNFTPYDFPVESMGSSLENIALDMATCEVEEGDRLQLHATVQPASMGGVGLFWRSTDTAVAAVSQDGLVSARQPGMASIIVTAPGFGTATATCQLTVNKLSYIPGDVNADGEVNGTDIVALVNYILGCPAGGNQRKAADLDRDGEITLTDLSILQGIVLQAE